MKNKALIAFGLSLAALSFADGWSLGLNSGVNSIDFTRSTLTTSKTEGQKTTIEKTPFTLDQTKIVVPLGLDLKYSLDGIDWGLHADNGNAAISDYKDFSNKVSTKLNAQTNFDATLGNGALKGYVEGKLVLLNSGNSDGGSSFGSAGDLSLKVGPKYMNGNHSFSLLGVYKSNELVTPKQAGVESNYSYKNGLLGLSGSVMYQFGNTTYDTYFKNDAKATVSYNNEAGTVNYAPSLEVQYNVGVKASQSAPAAAAAASGAAQNGQKMMNQVIPSAELLGLTLNGKYVSLELKDKVRFNYVNDQVSSTASEQLGIKNEAKVALGVSGQVGPVTLSSKLTGEAKTAADLKKDTNGFELELARTADTYGKDITSKDLKRLNQGTGTNNDKQNVLTVVTGKLENSLEYKYNTIVDLKLEANLKTDASFQTFVGKKDAQSPSSTEESSVSSSTNQADSTTDAISTWNGLTTTFKGTLTVTPVTSLKLTAGVGVDLVTKMADKTVENGSNSTKTEKHFGLTDIKPSASLGVTFSW